MSTFGCEGIKVKTRKVHKCQTCLRSIPAGKEAIHIKGMFEGDWQNWYMCVPCHDNEVFEGGEWISGSADEFWEWLMNQKDVQQCSHCGNNDIETDWMLMILQSYVRVLCAKLLGKST